MVKTFYKYRQPKKIFFTRDVKIRSYACGYDVLEEFKTWRKKYIDRWNSPKRNFWVTENGSIDGNYAKIDRVGELRVAELRENQKCIVKKPDKICPLWFEGCYLEVNGDGDILLNGKVTDFNLGPELKAWGVSPLFDRNAVSYVLFIFRNNEQGLGELKAFSMDLSNGLKIELKCSVTLAATLRKTSNLYCFGKHIFLVSDSCLHYYYFNREFSRFEEVAIETDEPNEGKEFCQNISGAPVCDSHGHVFWRSGNHIYFFPIGFSKRLGCIDFGDSNTIKGIQTFRDDLFIYSKSKITKEYTCFRYRAGEGETEEPVVFNKGSRYNLIYAERHGLLHYVKIPEDTHNGCVASMSAGTESITSYVDLSGVRQMFCIDGDLYLNCTYVGADRQI